MRINPKRIPGCWDEGFALDLHTLESSFLGYDEYGHAQFETQRSELGELLYKLKYKNEQAVLPEIALVASNYVRDWNPSIDLIVPVPPSRERLIQPLFRIADELGKLLNLPVDKTSLRKLRETPELKNVYDFDKRIEMLEGAHTVSSSTLRGHRVLLLDDLFRSGATLNSITELLRLEGGTAAVFALTLTRTRTSS